MKRSFFLTLGLYLTLFGSLYLFYQPPKPPVFKRRIALNDIRIKSCPKCKMCEKCNCMKKATPKKTQEKKSVPKKVEKKPPKRVIKPPPKKRIIKKIEKRTIHKRKIKKTSIPKKTTAKPSKKIVRKKIPEPIEALSKKVTRRDKGIKESVPRSRPAHLPKPSYQKVYIDRFAKQIQEAIEENRYYPRIARKTKKEGVVRLSFILRSSGEVCKLYILKSSGHKILDKAAKKTIHKASKDFPKPKEDVTIEVPIEYRLR